MQEMARSLKGNQLLAIVNACAQRWPSRITGQIEDVLNNRTDRPYNRQGSRNTQAKWGFSSRVLRAIMGAAS